MLPFCSESFVFLSPKKVKLKIYKSIILPADVDACEIWVSHTEERTQIEGV
jgi:hypothetical protein